MLDKNIFDLLPDTIKNAVQGLRELHQSPDELSIPTILQVANFAVQGTTNVDPNLWKPMPTSLYTVILNKSSGRKSTVLNEVMQGIKSFEKKEKQRYKNEILSYNILHSEWEKDFKKAVKDGDPLPQEPVNPVGSTYMLEKATVNGLIDALADVPHCGLINADSAEFFKSHAFQDKSSGRDTEMITTLSKLFSGERVSRQTGVKENNVSIEDRRFCMLAMLQEELADFLTNDNYRDQGFTHRLLISVVPDYTETFVSMADAKKRTPAIQSKLLGPFNDRVEQLLETVIPNSEYNKSTNKTFAMQQKLSHAAPQPSELMLTAMTVSETDESNQLIDEFRQLTDSLKTQQGYSKFANFMNRRLEHMLRVAATLAKFNGDKEITVRWVRAAIGIVEWFTTMRVEMDIKSNDDNLIVKAANSVYEWMQTKNHNEITQRELQQKGPRAYTKLPLDSRKLVVEEMISRGMIDLQCDDSTGKKTLRLM